MDASVWKSRRFAGKLLTYLGLFLTGAGMLGALQPHMELSRSQKVQAEVVGNEIAFRQQGLFGFRLQLKFFGETGEQRVNITTPVRAASEGEALLQYRGKHFQTGRTYEFYATPDDPNRLQPFKNYDWPTFGRFILIIAAGFVLFAIGMYLIRSGKTPPAIAATK